MSRKVVLYIATSLDGYIADNNGGIGWLEGHSTDPNSDGGYSEFIKDVDTVILGATSYNQIVTELSPDFWPYQGMSTYVFTHKKMQDNENAKFISSDIVEFINKLKNQDGKDIWICGGANPINQLVKANLIDEYHITIMPVILGSGKKLFSDTNPTINLKLVQAKDINGLLDVVYIRCN